MTAGPRAHPVAIGWLVASTVAAGFVLLFLARVLSGQPTFAVPGLVAVVFLIWFAQQQFTETHRRRYRLWPPGMLSWTGSFFGTGSEERYEIARAWSRRDPVRAVELSRLLGIGLLVLGAVAALVFVGSLLDSRP